MRGEYTVLLCADDCLTPGSIARSVEFMDAHPDVGLVYGTAVDFTRLEDVPGAARRSEVRPPIVHPGEHWVERLCRAGNNPIRNPEAMMRSVVLRAGRPVRAGVPVHERPQPVAADGVRVADVGVPPRARPRRCSGAHEMNYGGQYPHFSLAEIEQRWTAFAALLRVPRRRSPRAGAWERAGPHGTVGRGALRGDPGVRATRRPAARPPDEELLALADEIDPEGRSLAERLGWSLRRAARAVPGRGGSPASCRARVLRRAQADDRRATRATAGIALTPAVARRAHPTGASAEPPDDVADPVDLVLGRGSAPTEG